MKKIIAMIPARIGSNRLKYKNLALVESHPLIYYVIKAAKDSKIFDKIYINSDSEIFAKIAQKYKVDFYKRPSKLGNSNIKSDDVVFDFIKKINSDILVWVNPIAPLQTSAEIKKVVKYFVANKCDSLFTVVEKKVHAIFDNKPVNYVKNQKFLQTQELKPIKEMVYSLMIWNSKKFINLMNKKGYAFFFGKICFYPVNYLSGIIVKNKDDLNLIKLILKNKKSKIIISYDKLLLKK